MNEIKIFSPASIANLSCGFDILGVCLDKIGDEISVRKTSKKGIFINKITGFELSNDITLNVAGVAASEILKNTKVDFGFEIDIHKGIKPGSGIGSSAASSAGTVFAINKLLGEPFSDNQLIYFASKGEVAASGTLHADNVSAVLMGGFTFVRSSLNKDFIKLNYPNDLVFSIIHPKIEIKTKDSRSIIKNQVNLNDMIQQSANLGAFVHALNQKDYGLIERSMDDKVIEPIRSILIPKFTELKSSSLRAGALGCGISGSGPSVFSLCRGMKRAKNVSSVMKKIYDKIKLDYDIHLSRVNDKGIKIIDFS